MCRHPHVPALAIVASLSLGSAPASAEPPPNPVIEWAALVQPAIHSPVAPRSGGTSQILHTMVMLAVYDAVVAIEGGYRPYASTVAAPDGASLDAAVATAAYVTARARIAPTRYAYLDETYVSVIAAIPDGPAKTDGVGVGQRAAEALLARRADDGFDAVVRFTCSGTPTRPGEFEPDGGCPGPEGTPQPADVKVGRIRPFVLKRADVFRTSGPAPMTSRTYARDFVETRDYGRKDSAVRTPEQTDVAYFWAEHPYVHWNRNLIALARAHQLDPLEAARFFAMVHTSASDAVIAGFEAKYRFASWRPRTAIPRADEDDNPDTDVDTTWTPLLLVNHPEYPSGHGFWSTALLGAVAAYFGTTEVPWTIVTSKEAVPALVTTTRTYDDLGALLGEIGNARIWGGLHFRHAVDHGALIGGRVARYVTTKHFRPVRHTVSLLSAPSASPRADLSAPSASPRAAVSVTSAPPRAAVSAPSAPPRAAVSAPSASPRAAVSAPSASPRDAVSAPSASPRAAVSVTSAPPRDAVSVTSAPPRDAVSR